MIEYFNDDKISRTYLVAKLKEIMNGVDIPEVLHCISIVESAPTLYDGFVPIGGGHPRHSCRVKLLTVELDYLDGYYDVLSDKFTSHESNVTKEDVLQSTTITHYKILD